jgi:hypothetical protein
VDAIEMVGDDWRIVGGPRGIGPIKGFGMSHGWAWDIARVGVWRTVRVCVAGSGTATSDWPAQCSEALETQGRSIVEQLLHREDPPLTIEITTSGIIEK